MQEQQEKTNTRTVLLLRHCLTTANEAGVICGGDSDAPLSPKGVVQQARLIAGLRAELNADQDLLDHCAVVTSSLCRTLEAGRDLVEKTIEDSLNKAGGKLPPSPPSRGIPLYVDDLLVERYQGAWNGLDKAAVYDALARGESPPGGESEHTFLRRGWRCLHWLANVPHPFTIGFTSKGVLRVLFLLASGLATSDAVVAAWDAGSNHRFAPPIALAASSASADRFPLAPWVSPSLKVTDIGCLMLRFTQWTPSTTGVVLAGGELAVSCSYPLHDRLRTGEVASSQGMADASVFDSLVWPS
ncbi:MAG: phosphoglycerate mutase family protein [Alphaproteobacteria bacterium]|nr:phosphoglycerate mutase family protein [Alphaproteobacteria bacterium]